MWVILMLVWASFAGYGLWIASIKRRRPFEGILLGILLGPVGCIVEASLRARTAEEVEEENIHRQEHAQTILNAENIRLDAGRAESDRRHQEAQKRSEAARVRRLAVGNRFSGWFDRAVLRFGWYKALPEVAQPIVIGLFVALPLVVVMILALKGHSQ